MFGTWDRSPWFGSLRLIGGRIQMPLGDTPGADGLTDDGGDPTAHPEYDPELEAGAGGDDPPAPQPGAAAGRRPLQDPARPGQPGGAPGADGGTPQTYTADQYNQVVTGYRSLQGQNQQLAGQVALMQRQMAALTGVQPPAGQPGGDQPQLTEKDQAAIAAVYRLFPQLKGLLDKAPDILALPETVNGFRNQETARWQDIGTRMWEAFDKSVKESYGNRTLHEFAQRALDSAFVSWLETDKSAAARYRVGDTTLAAEFMRMYKTGVIVPAQQAGAPGTGSQPGAPRRPGQPQAPRVPRGGAGGGGTPPGARPGQPNVQNPGELHDAAADAFFSARG